jgi:phosphate starvation-inducible PhoH-like protein
MNFCFLLFGLVNSFENILTPRQLKYKKDIMNKDLDCIICNGYAGTGKTWIATETAVEMLHNKQYENLILTKPLVTVENEEIGYLPGDVNDKILPYSKSMTNYLKKHACCQNKIEFIPLGFMRGLTLDNTIVLADEMQNSSPSQMKMLLTRLGKNSKIIITGDKDQSDLITDIDGLTDLTRKLYLHYNAYYWKMYQDGISLIEFEKDDIKRSDFVKKIVEVYE